MKKHKAEIESGMTINPESRPISLVEPRLTATNPVIASFDEYPEVVPCSWDMHYGLELGFVSRGECIKNYHGYERHLTPGQFWLCGTWEPHGWKMLTSPCSLTIMLIWPPMLYQQRFAQSPYLHLYTPFSMPPELRPQIPSELADEAFAWNSHLCDLHKKADGVYKRIRTQLLLTEALLLLTEQWQPIGSVKKNSLALEQSISMAVETVLERRSLVSVSEAALMCGMSRQTFDRAFCRLMGISFAQFEVRHRIHGAALDVLQTNDPLKAIASRWGFSDASHLIRQFRMIYKCSPSQWRLNSESNSELAVEFKTSIPV